MSKTIVREYEGKTEKDAIDAAVQDLGLGREGFDVEIVDSQRGGFLNLNKRVRIRVHLHEEPAQAEKSRDSRPAQPAARPAQSAARSEGKKPAAPVRTPAGDEPAADYEEAIIDFMRNVTARMGAPMEPVIMYREEGKLALRLDGKHAGIIIGRKGKNLDALQVLVNVVANRLVGSDFKVVLDTENYRGRREEQLIQLAERTADQVMNTRKSRLLEPMNPFERRIIHTALNNINDIGTKSEGEGLYKQVRIFHRAYEQQ
ncbi:MAG: RNA-binding cell elongation regulator Jag/EloR [Spirochaeta sp.]